MMTSQPAANCREIVINAVRPLLAGTTVIVWWTRPTEDFMRYAILTAAVLLTACATPAPGDQVNTFGENDSYVPTGSNIPRKAVDKDGKRVVLSRDDAGRMLQDAQSMGNAAGSAR
jgi:hypothetical protein